MPVAASSTSCVDHHHTESYTADSLRQKECAYVCSKRHRLEFHYPTCKSYPIKTKGKIYTAAFSKVYYEKAPKERGERVPQHLKVCSVWRARLSAGDTVVKGRDTSAALTRLMAW